MSTLLTERIADQAIVLAIPTIQALLESDLTSRSDFHMLVGLRTEEKTFRLLAAKSFGDLYQWEHSYAEIATAKAELSARTGLDSREVQLMRPELLNDGDVIYWGSVIRGNVICAASGVQAFYDETAARILLALVLGQIHGDAEALRSDPSGFRFG